MNWIFFFFKVRHWYLGFHSPDDACVRWRRKKVNSPMPLRANKKSSFGDLIKSSYNLGGGAGGERSQGRGMDTNNKEKKKAAEYLTQLMKCWQERNYKARVSSDLQGYGMWKLVCYHYPLIDHSDMVNKKVKVLISFAPSFFLLGSLASLFLAWSAVVLWPHEAFSQELKSPPSVPCPLASHGMVLLLAVWLNIPFWE